jgi:hypothetical protein
MRAVMSMVFMLHPTTRGLTDAIIHSILQTVRKGSLTSDTRTLRHAENGQLYLDAMLHLLAKYLEMRPLFLCLALPMKEEWKINPYLGVLPLVFSALKRAFSAPRICTVDAGYLARFVKDPADTDSTVRSNCTTNNKLFHKPNTTALREGVCNSVRIFHSRQVRELLHINTQPADTI